MVTKLILAQKQIKKLYEELIKTEKELQRVRELLNYIDNKLGGMI